MEFGEWRHSMLLPLCLNKLAIERSISTIIHSPIPPIFLVFFVNNCPSNHGSHSQSGVLKIVPPIGFLGIPQSSRLYDMAQAALFTKLSFGVRVAQKSQSTCAPRKTHRAQEHTTGQRDPAPRHIVIQKRDTTKQTIAACEAPSADIEAWADNVKSNFS